jgi:hypothetical protein
MWGLEVTLPQKMKLCVLPWKVEFVNIHNPLQLVVWFYYCKSAFLDLWWIKHVLQYKNCVKRFQCQNQNKVLLQIWGLFEMFVDSPYYSELELCGGAVMVSFRKYLPWQAIHFLQPSTHFLKMCCRLFISSKFLASELHFHSWKSQEIAQGEIWTIWWMF